jgi:multiple antibiotic resistance protein
MVREVVTAVLVSFSTVFVVVDPFAAVPFFLAMTRGDSEEKRRDVAQRASVACFLALVLFSLAGGLLFRALGISLAAFKVAGGLLLLVVAIDMIRIRPSPARITEGEVEAGFAKEDAAVVPLAMPLLAGPGSIVTVVVLMGRARARSTWEVFPVLGAIAATAALSYLILSGAARVERVLGRTGMNVVERLAGLLLAAFATQFVIDGLAESFPALLSRL